MLKPFRFSSVLAAWHYMGLQTDISSYALTFSHISAIIVVVKLTCFRAGADVIILGLFLPSFLISLEEELDIIVLRGCY